MGKLERISPTSKYKIWIHLLNQNKQFFKAPKFSFEQFLFIQHNKQQLLLCAPAFSFKVKHSHPESIIATNMVSSVSNKYLIALIIELKAPKGKTMYSCYSRVNFYLCLSWHSSLFRVESQSCSLWLLPKEGKKRANNMALWGKKNKNKKI